MAMKRKRTVSLVRKMVMIKIGRTEIVVVIQKE